MHLSLDRSMPMYRLNQGESRLNQGESRLNQGESRLNQGESRSNREYRPVQGRSRPILKQSSRTRNSSGIDMTGRLSKTSFCNIWLKFGYCKRSVCHFAHSIHELKLAVCKFDDDCTKQYSMKRQCLFIHPHESGIDYERRTGLSILQGKRKLVDIKYQDKQVQDLLNKQEQGDFKAQVKVLEKMENSWIKKQENIKKQVVEANIQVDLIRTAYHDQMIDPVTQERLDVPCLSVLFDQESYE